MPSEATRAKELAGLIERVKAAEGPDREIDKAILAYLGYTWRGMDYWNADSTKMWSGPVFLTYSIDAALALVERLLPEPTFSLDCVMAYAPPIWTCEFHRFINPARHIRADKQTAPLAILLALLRALSQESQDAE